MNRCMIHKTADVQTEDIGESTTIWQFCVILKGAIIGKNCNINCHVFIENDVKVGDNVTVKSGVQLWDGITIENEVFIGPNVTFTNDVRPRSKQYPTVFNKTLIKKRASIGAGATILGGVTVGEFAMVGAGSIITKNVPSRALVIGAPAEIVGWLNDDGTKMKIHGSYYLDNNGNMWRFENEKLILKTK